MIKNIKIFIPRGSTCLVKQCEWFRRFSVLRSSLFAGTSFLQQWSSICSLSSSPTLEQEGCFRIFWWLLRVIARNFWISKWKVGYIGELDVQGEISADGDVFEVWDIVLENGFDFLWKVFFVLWFGHVLMGWFSFFAGEVLGYHPVFTNKLLCLLMVKVKWRLLKQLSKRVWVLGCPSFDDTVY